MNIQTLKKRIEGLEIKAMQLYVFKSITEEIKKVTDQEIQACYEKYYSSDLQRLWDAENAIKSEGGIK